MIGSVLRWFIHELLRLVCYGVKQVHCAGLARFCLQSKNAAWGSLKGWMFDFLLFLLFSVAKFSYLSPLSRFSIFAPKVTKPTDVHLLQKV